MKYSKANPVFDDAMPPMIIADFVHDQVQRQDELLATARAGEGNSYAAASLLYLFAIYPDLVKPEIREVIEAGHRKILRGILDNKTLKDSRTLRKVSKTPEIHPLRYFGFDRAPKNEADIVINGVSRNATEMVKLRYAYGATLTSEQLREAVTTCYDTKKVKGEPVKRRAAPVTIGDMERRLTDYVQFIFKNADEVWARRLARRSMDLDWNSPNRPIRYGEDWGLPG